MNFIFSILFFYSKFSRTQYEALTKISSVFSLFKSEPSVQMKIFLSLCSSVFSSKDLHRLNTSLEKSMIQIKFRKTMFLRMAGYSFQLSKQCFWSSLSISLCRQMIFPFIWIKGISPVSLHSCRVRKLTFSFLETSWLERKRSPFRWGLQCLTIASMPFSIESSEEINSLTCGVSLFINSMIERLFY